MGARAIASGTVSFGLVSIPIKLFSTSESSSSIQMNWLHEKCGGRVRQRYYCPVDDEIVGADDMTKGYEFAKGQYVRFAEDELKEILEKSTQTVEITEFLPLETVDPIFFEKSYYVGPNKGGERPYRLLAETMKSTARAALAKYAARGKMYLVLLRPFGDGLVMQQLRYKNEIRAFSEVPIEDVEIKEQELQLARQLVDQITSDEFQPEKYHDEVRGRLEAIIARKVEGHEITAEPAEEPKAQIIDLMAALKASLKGAAEGDDERKPAKAAPRHNDEAAEASGGN